MTRWQDVRKKGSPSHSSLLVVLREKEEEECRRMQGRG